MAFDMGIDVLTEEQYRELQQLGNFDTKTSSWIITPAAIRKLGGALFCDRRYNTVLFITTVQNLTMPREGFVLIAMLSFVKKYYEKKRNKCQG